MYDMLKGRCHFNKHSYLILLKQSWNRYKIQSLDAKAGRYKEKKRKDSSRYKIEMIERLEIGNQDGLQIFSQMTSAF
jgi:hypothetical protein